MNIEVLNELIQIKWTLFGLLILGFISAVFFVVTLAFRVRLSNSQALLQLRDNYLAELSLLESKGKYEEMYAKSEEMTQDYPNDLLANWYKALSSHQTGQLGAALSALVRIKEINSSWNSDAVDDYIDQIKSEMNGPRAIDA